jgi:hypothetical protein
VKDLEFTECDACAAKPGAPVLCAGCLRNRALIEQLRNSLRILIRGSIRTWVREHPDWRIVDKAAWEEAFKGLDVDELCGTSKMAPSAKNDEHIWDGDFLLKFNAIPCGTCEGGVTLDIFPSRKLVRIYDAATHKCITLFVADARFVRDWLDKALPPAVPTTPAEWDKAFGLLAPEDC